MNLTSFELILLMSNIFLVIINFYLINLLKKKQNKIDIIEDENRNMKYRYDDIHNALKDKILELKSEKSKNEKLLKKQTKGKKDERKKTRTT